MAIDIMDGKCVRLSQGDFSTRKIYSEDPLETALLMEDHGLRYLHLVDLDGARSRSMKNLYVLEKICTKTSLLVDYGGGLRTIDDMQRVFDAGAGQATAGSIAVKEPGLFSEMLALFGPEKIILGADFRDGMIAASGWLERSELEIVTFISDYVRKGVKYVICTDIGRDGMLEGPSAETYKSIISSVNVNLIASGGISSLADIKEMENTGCEGTIIGKAFYEGRITLKELAELC